MRAGTTKTAIFRLGLSATVPFSFFFKGPLHKHTHTHTHTDIYIYIYTWNSAVVRICLPSGAQQAASRPSYKGTSRSERERERERECVCVWVCVWGYVHLLSPHRSCRSTWDPQDAIPFWEKKRRVQGKSDRSKAKTKAQEKRSLERNTCEKVKDAREIYYSKGYIYISLTWTTPRL